MKKPARIARARKAGKASAGVRRGESSRENGKLGGAKGGRPVNPLIQQIMQEFLAKHKRGCSRQWAYEILKSRSK